MPAHLEPQMTQIAELTQATHTLRASLEASNAQAAANARFSDALDSLHAAAQAVSVAASASPQRQLAASVFDGEQESSTDGCDDGPCGCVGTNCCQFEIVLDKVRAIQPQLEPADSGDIPGLHNRLEVRIFASIGGIGIVVPSLSTTMDLSVGGVLLGGKPGMWVTIGRVIGTVTVRKGTSRAVDVEFVAGEIDEGVERPLGMKDEYGYSAGTVVLDCCVEKAYPSMPADLSFEHDGTGGGIPGMISLAFFARRVCC